MSYAERITGIQTNVLRVKNYSVITSNVLGQGAFGIVFKGTDAQKNFVAAKRIDGSIHPKIHSQDYERLKQLNHPNVIKVLDIERVENIFWVLMPFCEFGDLNKYYRTRHVTLEKCLPIMKQIVQGICYLHAEDIIHRDIKPGNILVASDSPLSVKLTDFDVTKFLDPEIETSVMSSNVGTNAFKAPEFHLRNHHKRIQYHRNVDVYAAGLIALSMLQYKKTSKLIPRIETPNSPSELHVPIGQLVAERIRYKVPQRNILIKDENISASDAQQEEHKTERIRRKMRELVRKMTNEIPKDRLSAAESLQFMQKICLVQMKKVGTFCTGGSYAQSMCVSSSNYIIVPGMVHEKNVIRVMHQSGGVFRDIISLCKGAKAHGFNRFVVEHPSYPWCVIESCWWCAVIWSYDTINGKGKVVYKDCRHRAMCQGPDNSVLIWNDDENVLQLKWSFDERELQLVKQYHAGHKPELFSSMCYIEETDMVILCAGNLTQAVKLCDSSPLIMWRQKNAARAVTHDSHGRLYICSDTKISIVDARDGDVLQQIELTETDLFTDVCLTKLQPQLRLLHFVGKVTQFQVEQ